MDKTITFYDSTHTIFAEMTLPGRSSLAVFRLSGDLAATACTALIGNKLPTPRIAYFSALKDPVSNEVIDHGIILWIPGPNSFTGEDVVEIFCHGNPIIVEVLIDRCVELGARPARAAVNELF